MLTSAILPISAGRHVASSVLVDLRRDDRLLPELMFAQSQPFSFY